jgi:hypothetical protein
VKALQELGASLRAKAGGGGVLTAQLVRDDIVAQ